MKLKKSKTLKTLDRDYDFRLLLSRRRHHHHHRRRLTAAMQFSPPPFDLSAHVTHLPKSKLTITIATANAAFHSNPVRLRLLAKLHFRSLSCSPKPVTAAPPPPDVALGGGGGGGEGKFPPGNGNGGGDGDGDGGGEDYEEREFGPLMGFDEVMRETEARGIELPADMLEAARKEGIRKLLLFRYFDLQALPWPLGEAIKAFALLRNRMLADPSFLFKVGTEVVIDSCCATFAEVQKRGKDFWNEFELYAADLLVGIVVDIALVGLLAPYARFGRASASTGPLANFNRACSSLPSSVFEAERPGCKFTLGQRIGTYFYKGVLYGSVGFVCGIIGQGIANTIMTAKRSVKKSEDDIPVPPLVKSAALWGVFLAVSSNTRYQIINGLERVVEASPVAKSVPPVALAFTIGIRFANNIYGGMQFVDWARWSGVQ